MIIIWGGISAGDADHVPATLGSLGVQKLFYKGAIKPGKPTWCGRLPSHGSKPGTEVLCYSFI